MHCYWRRGEAYKHTEAAGILESDFKAQKYKLDLCFILLECISDPYWESRAQTQIAQAFSGILFCSLAARLKRYTECIARHW